MLDYVVRRPSSSGSLRAAVGAALVITLSIAAAIFTPLSASASSTASISGVVTAADTGAGLADVSVELTLPGGTQLTDTSTDSTGAYSFTGLSAATYLVHFSDDYNTGHLGATSSPVTLTDGQAATVDRALSLGGSVTGTISLSTGPLTQPAGVALIGQGAAVTDPSDLFYISTAPDGTFSFTGLTGGTYTLAFAGPYGSNIAPQYWSGAASLADASYFTVTPGQTETDKNAVLQPGSSISGTVTGAGAPQSFGFVQAIGADGIVVGTGTTASDGAYTIQGLPSGSTTLKFGPPIFGNFLQQWWSGAPTVGDAQYFDVPPATALTGYDAQLSAGATISGTIKDAAGNPIPFSSAYALKAGNVYGVSAFADSAGNYSLNALSAGDYTVQFDASGAGAYEAGWWNGASSPATATVIHLADQQQVTGVDSALGAGATISGIVSGLTPSGATFPAANATITVVRPDGSQANQRYADQSGAYTIGNLPAGTYQLHIEPQGDTTDFAPQWYLNAGSQATSTPLTVVAGQVLDGTDVTLAAAVSLPPLTTSTPKISGTAKVGHTLTAKPGAWGPKHVTFAYQWLRSGTPIPGATSSRYRVVQADAGSTLSVSVTGSKSGYASATLASKQTPLVTGGKLTGAKPTISGTPRVGSTLTVAVGTWAPAPVTLAIQWYRDGKKIRGATAGSYTLTASDRGAKVSVDVTGSKSGFTSTTEKSSSLKVAK
jgi:hypothetical protein